MKEAVVLLSGGMDSATLLHYVKRRLGVREIHALSFDYGQKHAKELSTARWQARSAKVKRHLIVDASFLKGLLEGGSALTDEAIPVPSLSQLSKAARRQPPTYVPNRNMVFLSIAAAYAEARGISDVFYGAHAQDEYGYWDCTGEFLGHINRVLKLNRRTHVTIHMPFRRMKKVGVLKTGLGLGVDYSHTWSCYRGGSIPCGICPTCVDRAAAFRRISCADPLTERA